MTIGSQTFVGESEILAFAVGLDAIKSIALDASLVTADSQGRRLLKAGTILTKAAATAPNGQDQYKRYTGTGTIAGILAKDVEFAAGGSEGDTAAGMFFHTCVFKASAIVDYSTYGSAVAAALTTCKFETNV